MSFSENLLNLRKQAQLTQKQLAARVELSVQQIKNYEAARHQPTLDVIKKLAVALNVAADELIFDPGEREPKDANLKILVSAISEFPEHERETVISLLDAFVKKQRLSEMMGSIGA